MSIWKVSLCVLIGLYLKCLALYRKGFCSIFKLKSTVRYFNIWPRRLLWTFEELIDGILRGLLAQDLPMPWTQRLFSFLAEEVLVYTHSSLLLLFFLSFVTIFICSFLTVAKTVRTECKLLLSLFFAHSFLGCVWISVLKWDVMRTLSSKVMKDKPFSLSRFVDCLGEENKIIDCVILWSLGGATAF